MLSLKLFIYSKQQSAHSKHSDQRICQVVAHKRSKNTRKIVKLSGPKSGSGCLQEVVVYTRFQVFDWESFCVLDRWSVMGGGPQIVSNKECLQFIPHGEVKIQYKDDEDIYVNL